MLDDLVVLQPKSEAGHCFDQLSELGVVSVVKAILPDARAMISFVLAPPRLVAPLPLSPLSSSMVHGSFRRSSRARHPRLSLTGQGLGSSCPPFACTRRSGRRWLFRPLRIALRFALGPLRLALTVLRCLLRLSRPRSMSSCSVPWLPANTASPRADLTDGAAVEGSRSSCSAIRAAHLSSSLRHWTC